ncbi:GWxTD domain-containing protein [Rubrivirga marina]|uniref:GWxTD domain-containing protein n=1 Tax=Rubrivirga marina TaxID=1196024 RepID=UPI000BA98832|nr:GWxTD domain-containing protein [Rubrivirga marina]
MTRSLRALALTALALSAVAPSAQEPIVFRPDAATFQYSEDQSLVELYLSFRAATLPFEPAASGFEAVVPTHIVVRPVAQAAPSGAEAAPAYDRTLPFAYAVDDTTALTSTQVFVEQVRLAVAPGEYEVDVTLMPEGEQEVRALLNLTVPNYAEARGTAISAVQLATRIRPTTDPTDPLSKSGLSIRPNPDAFYGGDGAAVRYYAEVYGPPDATEDYTLVSFVAESATGAALPDHEDRLDRSVKPVDVIAGQIDVSTLPSGIYYLRLVALNEANEAVAEQSKRFFVINPDVAPVATGDAMSFEETLYGAMGEEELLQNLAHARVIATGREEAQMAALTTDEERRAFLAAFWATRDEDGVPSVNEARQNFYNRLRVVTQRFSEFGQEPYQTDRGRIFLTYGPPTEIDRRPFEAGMLQHEIWRYDNIPGEGQAFFVFVDRYSSDRYELIHSDVTGEVSIPNWEAQLIR